MPELGFSPGRSSQVGGAAFADDYGQPGLVAPSTRLWGPGQLSVAITNRLYIARLRTAGRAIAMINFGFILAVASSADDPWDFGVYDSSGNKLASSGAVTGKVIGSSGIKKTPLVQLLTANTTYYMAMVGVATSLLRFTGATYAANSGLTRAFGSAIPFADAGFADIGAAVTPAVLPALTAPSEIPLMFALEN